MYELAHLISVADAYKLATSLEDITVSSRVFGDSKKLPLMRSGAADITTARAKAALLWFSVNWPADAKWPSDVSRPAPSDTPATSPEAAQ